MSSQWSDPAFQAEHVTSTGRKCGQGFREFALKQNGIEAYSKQAFLDLTAQQVLESLDSFSSTFLSTVIQKRKNGADGIEIDRQAVVDHAGLINRAIQAHHAAKTIKLVYGYDSSRDSPIVPKIAKGWTNEKADKFSYTDTNGKQTGCWYAVRTKESTLVDSLDKLPECALNGTYPIGHESPVTGPITSPITDSIDTKRLENLEWLAKTHRERQASAIASMIEKKELVHRMRVTRLQQRVAKLREELKILRAPAPIAPAPIAPAPIVRIRRKTTT